MSSSINIAVQNGYKSSLFLNFRNFTFSNLIEDWDSTKSEEYKISNSKKLWLNPSLITNSIIEITNKNKLIQSNEVKKIFTYFEKLLCKHFLLKVDSFSIKELDCFFEVLNNYNIHTITLILDYNPIYYSDEFGELVFKYNFIKSVILFNSPFDKNFENRMHFVNQQFKIRSDKKKIEFKINHELISESFTYNTYFNRKLYIGPNGEIKNAPECEETFGFIQELNSVDDLKEIVSTMEFQKYWFVQKDLCDVCKHCEFRHMCVDNRIPFQRTENEWYHKTECNYNPFIAKWEGEPGYKTLEECGVISNDKIFSIDHEKIQQINHELWGE
jgi:hypothetical protein